MNVKKIIIKSLEKASGVNNIYLDRPQIEDHGDYSSNIALQLKNDDQRNPRQIAESIKLELEKDELLLEVIEKIDIAGPGFINFWIKKEILLDILSNNESYLDIQKNHVGKKVIVEYSSINIAKPFTIGHLRSTIIGDAISNLLEATGWGVLRDNHVGDWGTQFGKQIYAIKTWGNNKSEYGVRELVDLYVKFHEEAEKDPSIEDNGRAWFKKLEEGNLEAREIWNKCIAWSWKEFQKIYEILDVKFSKEFENGRGLGESFFEDKMQPIIQELENKGYLKEGKEGAKLFFFPNEKYPPAMILKKDGATLYHTRDLATDKYRLDNYKPDLVINEVGAEQKLYFEQLFEMEELLGWYKRDQRVHIYHGLIRLKDSKMSTRKGNVIWLEDILDEAIKRAKSLGSESDELAQIVAVGALKYNDLKRDPKTEIIFDWDEILTMQGNSGPYLQYTYARTQSILRKAQKDYGLQTSDFRANNSIINNLKSIISEEENFLLRTFIHFPEVVFESAEKYSPNLLCNYLYDLSSTFNTFYNKCKIVGSESEELRLALTATTGEILKKGLNLLGIQAPEKM